MIALDHLVVSAMTLDAGTAWVETTLGVTLAPGGKHSVMGTHNRLLRLGAEQYLEVISIDPDAPLPGRARWFDLDNFSGPPRLTNWVLRTDALDGVLARAPTGCGHPMSLGRADLKWRMAVPQDGRLPHDGAFPALIQWQGDAHPARRLPDAGCRLCSLDITHPHADRLRSDLGHVGQIADVGSGQTLNLSIHTGPDVAFRAVIDTPLGQRVLT